MKLIDFRFTNNKFFLTLPMNKLVILDVAKWHIEYDISSFDTHEKKLIHDILQRVTNMCSLCEHLVSNCKKHGLKDLHSIPKNYNDCESLTSDLHVYYFDDVSKTEPLFRYLTYLVSKPSKNKRLLFGKVEEDEN